MARYYGGNVPANAVWFVDANKVATRAQRVIYCGFDRVPIEIWPGIGGADFTPASAASPGGILPLTNFNYWNINIDSMHAVTAYLEKIPMWVGGTVTGFRESTSGTPGLVLSAADDWDLYWTQGGLWLANYFVDYPYITGKKLFIQPRTESALIGSVGDGGIVPGPYGTVWENNVKWLAYGPLVKFPTIESGLLGICGPNEPDQLHGPIWPKLTTDFADNQTLLAQAAELERVVRIYRLLWEQKQALGHPGYISGPVLAGLVKEAIPGRQSWTLYDFWCYSLNGIPAEPTKYCTVNDTHHHMYHGVDRWALDGKANLPSSAHAWNAVKAANVIRIANGLPPVSIPLIQSEIGRSFSVGRTEEPFYGTWADWKHTFKGFVLGMTWIYVHRWAISLWCFYSLADSGLEGQNLLDKTNDYTPYRDVPAGSPTTASMLLENTDPAQYDINTFITNPGFPKKYWPDYWKGIWAVGCNVSAVSIVTTPPPAAYPFLPTDIAPFVEWRDVFFRGITGDAPTGRVDMLLAANTERVVTRPIYLRSLGRHTIQVDVQLTNGTAKLRAWGFNLLDGWAEGSSAGPNGNSTTIVGNWIRLECSFKPNNDHGVAGLPKPLYVVFAIDYISGNAPGNCFWRVPGIKVQEYIPPPV